MEESVIKQEAYNIKKMFLEPLIEIMRFNKDNLKRKIDLGLMVNIKEILLGYYMHHRFEGFREKCNCLQSNRINLLEID